MAHDAAGDRIERLLERRDPPFDAPPFDPAVAEQVLGPSGRLLAPHRRLLERANGAFFFGHALHLFGACEGPVWHSLRAWNAPSTWRDAYEDLAAGLVFFAEDAFGDQYAYSGSAGEVVGFEAELGRVVSVAPSFVAWMDEMLERGASHLPVDVVEAERAHGRPHQPGTQLFAWPPFFSPESQEGIDIGHVDAVEAMRFRGQLARQIRRLPQGARIRLDLRPPDER